MGILNGYVLENERIAEKIYKLKIKSDDLSNIDIIPGQFIHLKISDMVLLRRPFSVYDFDKNECTLTVVYQLKGQGTDIMKGYKEGQILDLIAPLGSGFNIDKETENVFVVGGGIGIAPMHYLINRWNDKHFTSFLGYKNKNLVYDDLYFQNKTDKAIIATEDGSYGVKGFVTDPLIKELEINKPDLIIACGPIPLLKRIAEIADKFSVKCQISLEARMGCGIGNCMVCNFKIKSGDGWSYKRVCADGPVFDSQEVIFDE